jgi:hypothetical protein
MSPVIKGYGSLEQDSNGQDHVFGVTGPTKGGKDERSPILFLKHGHAAAPETQLLLPSFTPTTPSARSSAPWYLRRWQWLWRVILIVIMASLIIARWYSITLTGTLCFLSPSDTFELSC